MWFRCRKCGQRQDYQYIKSQTELVLPYSHYFYSGVVGSGLCVLSAYPITAAFFHAWSVNGYVHRIQHGDWFGGKGVGLCRIAIQGHTINFYTAHLHAEYNRQSDEYMAHRVIQAFDTAQFIQQTRSDSVVQILAGDLNTEPGDLAYRVLLSTSQLRDAYQKGAPHGTNESPPESLHEPREPPNHSRWQKD
uniref:sphingomyelin phosphodiesterase n=2 Tax=Lutzomyia longipalpis TaxID=7200 RepID=A0A1B0CW76_LUTLO